MKKDAGAIKGTNKANLTFFWTFESVIFSWTKKEIMTKARYAIRKISGHWKSDCAKLFCRIIKKSIDKIKKTNDGIKSFQRYSVKVCFTPLRYDLKILL